MNKHDRLRSLAAERERQRQEALERKRQQQFRDDAHHAWDRAVRGLKHCKSATEAYLHIRQAVKASYDAGQQDAMEAAANYNDQERFGLHRQVAAEIIVGAIYGKNVATIQLLQTVIDTGDAGRIGDAIEAIESCVWAGADPAKFWPEPKQEVKVEEVKTDAPASGRGRQVSRAKTPNVEKLRKAPTAEQRALLVLVEHNNLTSITEVAKLAECSPQFLSGKKASKFRRAWDAYCDSRAGTPRKGHQDSEGRIVAYDNESNLD